MKSIIDVIGREKCQELMGRAIQEAAQESRRLSLPEPVEVDGRFFRRFLDGRLEEIVLLGAAAAASQQS